MAETISLNSAARYGGRPLAREQVGRATERVGRFMQWADEVLPPE